MQTAAFQNQSSRFTISRTQHVDLPKFSEIRRGSVAIESAVVLCLVIAALLFGVMQLGSATNRQLATVDSAMSLGNGASDSGATVATETDRTPGSEPNQTAITKARSRVANQLAVGLLVLALILLLWRRKPAEQPVPVETMREASDHRARMYQKRKAMYAELADKKSLFLGDEVTVQDLMSKNVVVVPPNMRKKEVEEFMDQRHLHHALVHNGRELLGVISDRDLRNKHDRQLAKDLMTADPLTTTPTTNLSVAISQMLNKRISCLPVVANGSLVGVVSSTDFIMGFQAVLKAAAEANGTPTDVEKVLQPVTSDAMAGNHTALPGNCPR